MKAKEFSKSQWRVTGTKLGKAVSVIVEATNHNDAVRIASKRKGLLIVVQSCVLVTTNLEKH